MYKIFVVEDDDSIRGMYEMAFPADEFVVYAFANAEHMFSQLSLMTCDLIILDIMLPGMSGMQALSLLKSNAETKNIPVIIASAKGDELNKVNGLDGGADDYISKPFGMLELIARVRANLRKNQKNETHILTFEEITINDDEHSVEVNGQNCVLTLKEYKLLSLLMENIGKVVDRDTILAQVWNYEFLGETRTLDMHIKSLRHKLAQYTDKEYIFTIRGLGYKFYKSEK
ncbi:MAG: response regulator transcription factor [Clostridia bacterium]